MKTIVFDLDNTLFDLDESLRDMHGVPYPTTWNWSYEGKAFDYWVNKNNQIALKAGYLTDYGRWVRDVYQKEHKVIIMTARPMHEAEVTDKWLKRVGIDCELMLIGYTTEDKERAVRSNKDMLLVEDNPNFTDYERIVLLDKPYNKDAKADLRVFNVSELEQAISHWLSV